MASPPLPDDDRAELARLDHLTGRRRDREALPSLAALAARHPAHGTAVFLYGRALRRIGGAPEAGAVFAQAARLAPDDPHIGLGLAWSALDAGDLGRAVALARPALDVRALRGPALAIAAREREEARDTEAARALWLDSYEAAPMLDALEACERLSDATEDRARRRAPWPIGIVQRRWLFRTVERALEVCSRERFGELPVDRVLTAGCDHGLRHVAAWADTARVDRVTLYRALADRGGFCDCEVCLNAARTDDDDVQVLLVTGRVDGRFVKSPLGAFFARGTPAPPRLGERAELDLEAETTQHEALAVTLEDDTVCIPPQLVADTLVSDLVLAAVARDASEPVISLLIVAPDLPGVDRAPTAELSVIDATGVISLPLTRPPSTLLTTKLPWITDALAALDDALPPTTVHVTRDALPLGDTRLPRLLVRGERDAHALALDETGHALRQDGGARAPLPPGLVLSRDGAHATWLRARRNDRELVLEDRASGERRVLAVGRFQKRPAFGPDARSVYVVDDEETVRVEVASGASRRLGLGTDVVASADGRSLAIARERDGTISLTDVDGRPLAAPFRGRAPLFSPRGDRLAYLAREDARPEGTSFQPFVRELATGATRRVGPACQEACWLSFADGGAALVFQARVSRRWIPLDDGRSRLEESERLVLVSLDEGDAHRELYATNGGSMRIVSPIAHPRLPIVAFRTQDAPRLGQRLVVVGMDGAGRESVLVREPLTPLSWLDLDLDA